MSNKPVYPKEDPEYKKRRMEAFYKLVRETRWDDVEEVKPRKYRYPKKRIETKPRTESERRASFLK